MGGGRTQAGAVLNQIWGGDATTRREGMTASEVQAALAWKARHGGGWQAVAGYCGRPVEDVRRACLAAMVAAPPPVAAPAAPAAGSKRRLTALERAQNRVLSALRDRVMEPGDLALACGIEPEAARRLLRGLLAEGRVAHRPAQGRRGGLWTVDAALLPCGGKAGVRPAARTRAERLAELRDRAIGGMSFGDARSVREIAEAAGVSRPFVSRLMAQLVAEGRAAFAGTRRADAGRRWNFG